MREWFESLTPRERQALVFGGVALGLLLFFSVAWWPLARNNAKLVDDVAEDSRQLAWMQSAALEVRTLGTSRAGEGVKDSRTLIARVTAELRRDNIVASQVRPEGEERLRLTLEGVPFTRLLQPLARLQSQYAVRVQEALVEPGGAQGVVDARLLLARSDS